MVAKKPKVRKRGVGRRIEVREKSGGLRFDMLRMEPREQYALFSAVRGPDNGSGSPAQYMLKCCLTERVRGIVFVGGCPGMYTTQPLQASDLARIESTLVKGRGSDGFKHYVDHLRLAVKGTVLHPIWGGNGISLLDLLTTASI